MKLTSEQKQYIKDHPTESAYAMAKRFGCSEQSVYYYLHKYHGDSFLEVKKAEQAHKHKVVREMYPTHSASEIAAVLGVTKAAVNNMAKRLGVRHTEETKKKFIEKYVYESHRPEAQERRLKSLKETIRKEQMRIRYGLPQKTKRKFNTIPVNCFSARNYLVRQYNYFYDKSLGQLLTIFYDQETNRLPIEREKYYNKRFGIIFSSASE